MGPYKIIGTSSPNRYDLRRVGDLAESTKITSAAGYQLRLCDKEWSPEECSEMLESYELDAFEFTSKLPVTNGVSESAGTNWKKHCSMFKDQHRLKKRKIK
ncbi:hypothetical protein ABEB36_014918 [Hypothenemus hampei]|uniref:Uncharacterized protein n=1 Tax=Hypothenemus hampei TaxID=57062 RepID=A0ABD1E3C8_HYPHA